MNLRKERRNLYTAQSYSKRSKGSGFTLMFVPHSQKRVFNFHINKYIISFFSIFVIFVLGGFIYFTSAYLANQTVLTTTTDELERTQANLDNVLTTVADFNQVYLAYRDSLKMAFSSLGIDMPETNREFSDGKYDLASIEILNNDLSDLDTTYLQDAKSLFENAISPIESVTNLLNQYDFILNDLPHLWPVQGHSRITLEFGPNINPVTGQWYMHKGIDIAGGAYGLPILASANGRIVKMHVSGGYGLEVIIEHKYGFKTRYSHMSATTVSEGQNVKQGQIVGRIGNSGYSTGPHLHFEIMIGSEVIDPMSFLKMTGSNIQRWSGNRGDLGSAS